MEPVDIAKLALDFSLGVSARLIEGGASSLEDLKLAASAFARGHHADAVFFDHVVSNVQEAVVANPAHVTPSFISCLAKTLSELQGVLPSSRVELLSVAIGSAVEAHCEDVSLLTQYQSARAEVLSCPGCAQYPHEEDDRRMREAPGVVVRFGR